MVLHALLVVLAIVVGGRVGSHIESKIRETR